MHSSGAAFRRPDKETGKLKRVDAQYYSTGELTGDGVADDTQGKMRRYQQSKLAQLVAGLALHEAHADSGSKVKVLVCHPGIAATDLVGKVWKERSGCLKCCFGCLAKKLAQTAEEGARPLMTCVFSDQVDSGEFWGPKDKLKGPPIMCGSSEVLAKQRGPDAWDLIHNKESQKMCIELSDAAVNAYLW